jgi:hypothetical protein
MLTEPDIDGEIDEYEPPAYEDGHDDPVEHDPEE